MHVPLRRWSALEKVDGVCDDANGHDGGDGHDDDDNDHDDDNGLMNDSKRLSLTDSGIQLCSTVLGYIIKEEY